MLLRLPNSACVGWHFTAQHCTGLIVYAIVKPLKHLTQLQVHASAASAAGDPAEALKTPSKPWPGIKLVPLLGSVAVGLALRFLVPVPTGLSTQAWTLLSIFVSTIAGDGKSQTSRIGLKSTFRIIICPA